MVKADDDLVSYWEDFPLPSPLHNPPIPGVLWFGLANGDIEVSHTWYSRVPVKVRHEDARLQFRGAWVKPLNAPVWVDRVCLWSTKTRGTLLYTRSTDGPINLAAVESAEMELLIRDVPVEHSLSFRRMLKGMQLL